MKPCGQCQFSTVCLPMGFIKGMNKILLPIAREHFQGMVDCGIVDPRDNTSWNGVKKMYKDKLLDKIPDTCIEKRKRKAAMT